MVSATAGLPCSGSYEIISPNPEPISISVVGPTPTNKVYFESKYSGPGALRSDQTEGSFTFDAEIDGDYSLCFANGNSNSNDGKSKLIAFNYRVVDNGEADYELPSVQSELLDLQQGLNFFKDHQSFMNQRENIHKLSLERISWKVTGWTLFETILLFAIAWWQITYIRSFFELKRKM